MWLEVKTVIELVDVQKISGDHTVIEVPKLRLFSGAVSAFVGPAQSGVDDLFKLLCGQSRPTAGYVKVAGINPAMEREALSRAVGVLFEADGLYESRSALSNLTFTATLYGESKGRVQEVLQYVGLGDQGQIRTDRLAAGLRRRLAFGRALLHHPSILLLDNPFTRCDQSSIDLLQRVIREQADLGTSVVIFARARTHLEALSDVIYVIDDGRIVDTSLLEERQEAQLPFKIPVKGEGSVSLVHPAELMFADAEEGKAQLHLTDGRVLLSQFTLSELEQRLHLRGFFRAHRGYLVNLQHVNEVIPFTRDSYSLRLSDPDGTLVPLSKSAASELREMLGY
ncbi:MAG: ATP-binding cassette domain-containing protein [Anaerolineales bacterium]|nr:MAG: ATP-binding cassette domain-containing protein [Anaerolineales bacterium]